MVVFGDGAFIVSLREKSKCRHFSRAKETRDGRPLLSLLSLHTLKSTDQPFVLVGGQILYVIAPVISSSPLFESVMIEKAIV